jgi:S1-C subfamily serine protease
LLLVTAFGLSLSAPARADETNDALAAIVGIHAVIPSEARTASILGTERSGSGVVIDASGLVLTIGYLIVEASTVDLYVADHTVPATVVGYDQDSGLGVVRALAPIGVKPIRLGDSGKLAERQPLIAASLGGAQAAIPVMLVSKRRFAGYWEYMIDDGLFTAPPHPEFGGAALIDRQGALVGIGSLLVNDAGEDPQIPGNMFVPIDLLKPVLADLLASGRSATPPRPWLGVTSAEVGGHVLVTSVSPESPAAAAGLSRGDAILAVGGTAVASLIDFYTLLWAAGPAGSAIELTILSDGATRDVTIQSIDRRSYLKLDHSL